MIMTISYDPPAFGHSQTKLAHCAQTLEGIGASGGALAKIKADYGVAHTNCIDVKLDVRSAPDLKEETQSQSTRRVEISSDRPLDPSVAREVKGSAGSKAPGTLAKSKSLPYMADTTLKRSEINIPGSKCLIYTQVSLANLTSYRVGGPAEWYIDPHSLSDLQQTVAWARSKGLAITVLGAGSNLLVSARGLPGLVVCTRNLRYTKFDQETSQVISGAGVPIARLARQVARQGWQGLEWAVGIPGTVGGAVVMNAGAHKSSIADILVSTQVLSQTGTTEKQGPSDLGYGYRTSVLQGGESLVTEATFQLQPVGDPVGVMATTNAHLKQRHATQPYHLPSCGSVFRNQEPYKAGWLIEQTGLKGYKIGGAQVSELHANFILNCGGATASDIFKLIGYVQEQVEQRWSIRLEPEVKIMGEF